MNVLDVSDFYKLKSQASFPFFAKPEEIDAFSIDSERNVFPDRSQLKIFSCRSKLSSDAVVGYDLSRGYETFANKDETIGDEHLDCFLHWILHYKKQNFQKSDSLKVVLRNADFVCWRGLFTKVACTPYDRRENWIICVMKFKDVYFLSEFETEEKKQQKLRATDREKLMTYWGHSFERYVTESSSGLRARDPSPHIVNSSEQYCSVVRSKIGAHRLVFGGEVDCVENGEYLELKTNRYFDTDRQRYTFHRFKLIKWWLQSFLIGIDRIVCGFRDDNGVVLNLQEFRIDEMPTLGKEHWSGAVCFNFLHDFLNQVQQRVTENDAKKVYKFEYVSMKQKVTFEEADPDVYGFLRPWFTNAI